MKSIFSMLNGENGLYFIKALIVGEVLEGVDQYRPSPNLARFEVNRLTLSRVMERTNQAEERT